MIEFVPRDGAPEATLCPAFICDGCREQVIGHGNVLWLQMTSDLRSPLYVSHANERCNPAVEKQMEHLYGERLVYSEGIEEFLVYLGHNAVKAFADDAEGRYHLGQVVRLQAVETPVAEDIDTSSYQNDTLDIVTSTAPREVPR